MKRITALLLATALGTAAAPALAQEKGDFTAGIGVAGVLPTGGDGTLLFGTLPIDVDSGISVTLTGEYFIMDNVGIELLAAYPFKHDVRASGPITGAIARVEHLPPTLSLQYHFTNSTPFKPFVGVGLNYTTFVSARGVGALAAANVDVDDSWGVALHGGIDYAFTENGSMRFDVRWAQIESDVKLNGVNIGKAEINPWIFGVSYVHRF